MNTCHRSFVRFFFAFAAAAVLLLAITAGAAEAECAHPDCTTARRDINPRYTDVGSDVAHQRICDTVECEVCRKCGEDLSEWKKIFENVDYYEHEYDENGVCTVCGHARSDAAEPDKSVSISADKTDVLANEEYFLTVYAPDAVETRLYIAEEDEEEDWNICYWSYCGGNCGDNINEVLYGDTETREYYAVAWFSDGSTAESEHIAVTASIPYEPLAESEITMEEEIYAEGSPITFTIGEVEHAYEYYISIDDSSRKTVYRRTFSQPGSITLPGCVFSGGCYRIYVQARGLGANISRAYANFAVGGHTKTELRKDYTYTYTDSGSDATHRVTRQEIQSDYCDFCDKIVGEIEPVGEAEIFNESHEWNSDGVCVYCGRLGWEEPEYSWAEDFGSVTARRRSLGDPETEETETVGTACSVEVSPTETEAGTAVYTTAEFRNLAFAQQEKTRVIPALEEMDTLVLPAQLTTIEEEAFAGSASEAVIIPDGCRRIEKNAFANCGRLRYVWVPRSVETIDGNAFENNAGLIMDYEAKHSEIVLSISTNASSYDFGNSVSLRTIITYPDGSTDGIEAAYPNVRFAATLLTAGGEAVPGFIVQVHYGTELTCNFPLANDDMEPGDYKIRVETDAGISGESPVFHYTADKSGLPDPSECSLELTLNTDTFGLGEVFKMSARVTDPDGNPAVGIKVGFIVLDPDGNETNFYDPYAWLWNLTGAAGTCAISSYVESDGEEAFQPGTYIARIFLVDTNPEISDEKVFVYTGRGD